eukprot:CAMPEP_0195527036 /NCGR_PEP_ID=MMETSP0794_2-20130614/28451_1 /TAXON_ID=515487 /ORGANISM="Stephanopyxis turris, Strain CCMP 815" /LENGTH=339 /DNA_ID=CAMNT_0040657859 /DNA_START=323 /DNA_END=1342 /DNA_ORIENTATION=+
MTDKNVFFSSSKNLGLTFDHCSDLRPWSKEENKFIHPTGTVAKVKFVSSGDHPFTGMFQGNPFGLVRLSLTGLRNDNKFTPSLAMKFFRNGLPSANLLTMLWFGEQKSTNFFAHEHSNHGEVSNGIPLNEVHEAFIPVDEWWRMTGLSDIASTDWRGNRKSTVFPYEVRLVANGDLTMEFQNMQEDAEEQARILETIEEGTILYWVFGRESPNECRWHTLGSIVTTSEMISSEYGDFQLFFRHQRMKEDIALNPQWEQHMRRERMLRSNNNDRKRSHRSLNRGINKSLLLISSDGKVSPDSLDTSDQDVEKFKLDMNSGIGEKRSGFDVDGCPFNDNPS